MRLDHQELTYRPPVVRGPQFEKHCSKQQKEHENRNGAIDGGKHTHLASITLSNF